MAQWTVYALKSLSRKYIYVGLTNNLARRFDEHQKGKVQSTKAYVPFKILYTESFDTRIEARKREKYFKSGIGKEFLKKS
jgi:putative endonuclease